MLHTQDVICLYVVIGSAGVAVSLEQTQRAGRALPATVSSQPKMLPKAFVESVVYRDPKERTTFLKYI